MEKNIICNPKIFANRCHVDYIRKHHNLQNPIIITYELTESLLSLLKQENTSINEVAMTLHHFLESRILKKMFQLKAEELLLFYV